jgi:hypothetical protein
LASEPREPAPAAGRVRGNDPIPRARDDTARRCRPGKTASLGGRVSVCPACGRKNPGIDPAVLLVRSVTVLCLSGICPVARSGLPARGPFLSVPCPVARSDLPARGPFLSVPCPAALSGHPARGPFLSVPCPAALSGLPARGPFLSVPCPATLSGLPARGPFLSVPCPVALSGLPARGHFLSVPCPAALSGLPARGPFLSVPCPVALSGLPARGHFLSVPCPVALSVRPVRGSISPALAQGPYPVGTFPADFSLPVRLVPWRYLSPPSPGRSSQKAGVPGARTSPATRKGDRGAVPLPEAAHVWVWFLRHAATRCGRSRPEGTHAGIVPGRAAFPAALLPAGPSRSRPGGGPPAADLASGREPGIPGARKAWHPEGEARVKCTRSEENSGISDPSWHPLRAVTGGHEGRPEHPRGCRRPLPRHRLAASRRAREGGPRTPAVTAGRVRGGTVTLPRGCPTLRPAPAGGWPRAPAPRGRSGVQLRVGTALAFLSHEGMRAFPARRGRAGPGRAGAYRSRSGNA